MKLDKRFLFQIAIVCSIGLVIGVSAVSGSPAGLSRAVIAGAILSTLNVLAGFFAIELTFEKSHATFLKAVLGGMGIRIGATLLAIVILVRFAGFHATALILSALGFYIVYLILEIIFLQKKSLGNAR